MVNFIAFGDSFVNIFSALKNENFTIVKYSGAPMKGIVNKNKNYDDMLNKLKKTYDYGFFCFGQVDAFFSHYHKKYVEKRETDISSYIDDYVKIIKELPNIKHKYILNIQPTTIRTKDFIDTLIKYKIIDEDFDISIIPKKEIKLKFRQNMIIKNNEILKKSCEKYGINFIDVFDKMIDKETLHIKNIFKVSNQRIHTTFEYTLLLYIKFCIPFILNYYDFNILIKKMENEYNNYINEKIHLSKDKDHSLKFFSRSKIEKYLTK